MALSLDTSRPLRSLDELRELAGAISAADPTESEPDWLEWKREADLEHRRWHVIIAKFIAGFANRDPAVAKREVGGCGYLVLGAEPGNVLGVSPIDNARLHAGVSRFVGTTARWNPQYIEVNGVRVLVITVEPPEYGDGIVSMIKGYQSHERRSSGCREGDVFVRHAGTTDLATQADYNMLVERAAPREEQGARIGGITVGALSPATAVAVAAGPDEVRGWCEREESRLVRPLEQRTPNVGRHSSRDAPLRASLWRPIERRSEAEYRREVEAYLSDVAPLLPWKAHADALRERAPGLQLVLVNQTELNFRAVRVEIVIHSELWAYENEAHARPRMPEPPRRWGVPKKLIALSYSSEGIVALGNSSPSVPRGPYITNSTPTMIVFDDVDLRPSSRVTLAPIYLIAGEGLAGSKVSATWRATASSASGVAHGECAISIPSSIVTPLAE